MTSKEALDMINEALYETDNSVIFKHTGLNELKKVIEQAQKQEKLLELYRKLITVKDELIPMARFGDEDDEMEEIETNLEKQIKELENEKR